MPDIEEFLKPISDEAPAGVDVRYEVVYDEIREAREFDPPELEATRRDDDPPLKVADYKEVRKLGEAVLKKQGKHLQIAAWLTEAWTRMEGLPGLKDGLDLQRRLLEDFWDSVFPEVDDGDLEFRVAPLEWSALYLGPSLDDVSLSPGGHTAQRYQQSRSVPYEKDVADDSAKLEARKAQIDRGLLTPEEWDKDVGKANKAFYKELVAGLDAGEAAVDALESLCDERFESLAPSFRPLRERLTQLRRIVEPILEQKLAEDPDPVDVTAAGDDDVPSASSAAASGHGGLPLEPVSVEDAGNRIAAAARFLRGAAPTDPAPYLMVRGLRWGELRKGGSEVDPRLLEAPPTRTRTHLKGLLLDGRWKELLEAAEDVMATPFGRGWLDLQRYVFTALDGLGSSYDPVERGLRGALRGLLVDLPDLPDLTLMDDTPTANRETRLWLSEEGFLGPLSEDEQARLQADASATMAGGRDVSERARERVRAGQPQKAIELLMKAADDEGSVRGRSLRRAEAAGVMVDHGLAQVAMPILRDIMDRIEQHRLEEWEDSETVAVPMALLWRCIDRTGGDPAEKEQLYLRVCRLDPMQAILFSTDGGGSGTDDVDGEGDEDDGDAEG